MNEVLAIVGVLVLSVWPMAAEVVAGKPIQQEEGLLAHYTFEEGAGPVLKDHSGNGNDGNIHGAKWVKSGSGYALSFQQGDYVDLGTKPDFNLPGDRAITAWVKLTVPGFPDGSTNWVVFDGGESYPKSGYVLRIDGESATVMCRHCAEGRGVRASSSRRHIENKTYYHLAVSRHGSTASLYIDGLLDTQFELFDSSPAIRPFTISQAEQSFYGLMDDMALYRRALSTEEVIKLYQQGAARHGKDASWIGKIRLAPYCHYDEGSIAVEADFAGILPLQPGQQASLELGLPGQAPAQVEAIKAMPETGRYEYTFPIRDLPKGTYEIAAIVKDAAGRVSKQRAVSFAVPYEPVKAPSPSAETVALLPEPPRPVPYRIELGAAGGFRLNVNGEDYSVESAFSWPNGDFNLLSVVPPADGEREKEWKATSRQVDEKTYLVSASGKFYKLERTIRLFPTHVNVQDTLTNRTAEPIGIILKNSVTTKDRGIASAYLAGAETQRAKAGTELQSNPTLFLKKPGLGIGFVALDDVFIVQSKADFDLDRSALCSTQFALDKGASYTLEWSLYLNSSGDYYDFINQIRKDERRNGKVDGGVALYYDRFFSGRGIPSKEYVDLRKIKYVVRGSMVHIPDDPQISLEGIEFLQYPKARMRMKEEMAGTHKLHPALKLMFHVAPSLYATNKPAETFRDSRVIKADGKQAIYYEGQEGGYFSEERKKQGWHWWAYYPTLDNSFGRELLRSVDVMVDEMGCHGVFIDGFLDNYGGKYTYDRWDGHTAEIDPTTKTITRKVGSVLLLSQDAMVAFSRKMRDKGGHVVANGSIITRTIGKETYIIYDKECVAGPSIHLAPSVATLSNPSNFSNEKEFYWDALNKLKWGSVVLC